MGKDHPRDPRRSDPLTSRVRHTRGRAPGYSGTPAGLPRVCKTRTVTATDSDPVALQHFELVPSHALAEVLGKESLEVWALRISGGSVREVATIDPVHVVQKEFVFAVPLDVMGRLAQKLTEVYERQSGAASP